VLGDRAAEVGHGEEHHRQVADVEVDNNEGAGLLLAEPASLLNLLTGRSDLPVCKDGGNDDDDHLDRDGCCHDRRADCSHRLGLDGEQPRHLAPPWMTELGASAGPILAPSHRGLHD
jgi:hypothetical protein